MMHFPACVWSSLLLLLTLASASVDEFCPLADEGSRYELTCAGSITSPHYFIEWILTDLTANTNSTLTMCGVGALHCDTNIRGEYEVTNNGTGGERFHSTLIFKNVSAKHRHLRFTCQIWEVSRDKKVVIRACKMAVFKMGRNQNYAGAKLPDGRIQLRYAVSDIFPGISCQFSEKIDGKTTRSSQPMPSTNEVNQDQSLYYSSCEAMVYPLENGLHEFTVLVKPDYPIALMGIPYDMGRFQVVGAPRVKIEQRQDVTMCNENNTTKVQCIVNWFESPLPEFQFSYDGRILSEAWPFDKFDNNDYTYKYVATYHVPMKTSLHRALMVCMVGYTNAGQHGVIQDTKHLEFDFPPQKPVFQSQGHAIPKHYFDINRGENASLECHASTGHPKVRSIQVVCMGNGNNISSTANASDRVTFVVYGNDTYQKAFCVCYVWHKTDFCDPERKLLEFVFLRIERLRSQRDPEKSEAINKMTPIYYIIMATLVLVFLPILIGTCVFIHKKGHSLYYYYTALNRIYSPGGSNSSHTPSVPQRPPAPPPIPERQTPAPPVPPRPTRPPEEQLGSDAAFNFCPPVKNVVSYLNEQVWMDDPEIKITEQPVKSAPKKSVRKKRKKTRSETKSFATVDDYLIPLRPDNSSSDNQNDEVFYDQDDLYLTMHGVQELRSGFAPSLPKRNLPSAPIWRSEDCDLDNTVVKSLDDQTNSQLAQRTDDTEAKRLSYGRRSPLRYVKLKGKSDRQKRNTGSESEARHADALVRETNSVPCVDTSFNSASDEESHINVDIATLSIRPPPENRHFPPPVDTHNCGPNSLTSRASRVDKSGPKSLTSTAARVEDSNPRSLTSTATGVEDSNPRSLTSSAAREEDSGLSSLTLTAARVEDSGPSSLKSRAARVENIYVDNSSIY